MSDYAWFVDLSGGAFSEDTTPTDNGGVSKWIDLMQVGKYKHPLYGEIDFTPTKLQQFADNVNNDVRGIALDIDYDHKQDPSKGHQAAGWIQKARFQNGVLQGLVEFTKSAVASIKEGAYRYFSPEFKDSWEDATGKKHNNVLFGGGLTNRPFLKDLLPINLSELSFETPTPAPEKENEVDPKQLRASVGLSETATDAEVEARLGLIKQLGEAFPNGAPVVPPAPAPTVVPPTPVIPAAPPAALKLSEGLKELAESNPQVKALVDHMTETVLYNQQMNTQLRESAVTQKLAEFDASKITLTPVARERVRTIMMHEALTPDLAEQIWTLMDEMKKGHSFFVELGERGGVSYRYGSADKTAVKTFQDEAAKIMLTDKVDYITALEKISKENPALYDQYREESFAFRD